MSAQERRARRERWAAQKSEQVVETAVAKVVAARPSQPPSPQDQAAKVKELRDSGMAWWLIGQQLGLAGVAHSASEAEAKRGAGAARRLYAAANRGTVPRTNKPRAGSTPKPSGPASRAVPAYVRKQQLVDDGHVIPRDMPDEEVEALVRGRAIEWAIDMAKLTDTDPATWGPEDGRWVKQEARVAPVEDWVWVGEDDDCGGERVLKFREYSGYDTDRQRHMSGPTRVVRVDAIFTVR